MQVRLESGPGKGDRIYLALLALICLLLASGHVLAQDEYRVAAYDAAKQQNRAEIRFVAADESLVEFAPPFTIASPITSLATIIIVHHDSANVVPQTAPYILNIPPGLRVFRDAAATLAIASGQALMTKPNGYDTLWAGASSDITTDRTFVLTIPSSTVRMQLTFVAGPSTIHTPINKAQAPPSGESFHDALGRKYAPKPMTPNPPVQVLRLHRQD